MDSEQIIEWKQRFTNLISTHLNKKLAKLFFILCVVVILVYASSNGIIWNKNITAFFMSVSTVSQHYGYQDFTLSFYTRQNLTPAAKQKWQQTNIYEIFDKYKALTHESCENVCDKNNLPCQATTDLTWGAQMFLPTFKFMPLLSEFQYIYPFEVDYMSYPPMTNQTQLPSFALSKVFVYGSVNDQVVCAIGDVISGRVDLVDGYGKQRIMGGDEVRVWVVDSQTSTYKAAGHVTDMRNGSYQISFSCLWAGNIQLNVAVAYPREYLRIFIQQIHLGVTWFYAVRFRKGTIEEVTICLVTPNIPGRPCLCNLTSTNEQSLYCGRPLDSRLGCDDWVETYSLPVPPLQNVTPAEFQLNKDIPKDISTHIIPHNITVIANNTGTLPTLKPCSETGSNITWKIDNLPNGFWSPGNKWTSLLCDMPILTSQWATSCLTNTNMWVFGDSNGIRVFDSIVPLVSSIEVSSDGWFNRRIMKNKMYNISLVFTPTEYPLFLGKIWRKRVLYGGVAKQIDNIPSTGTHLVLIHYYMHLATSHPNIFFLRLKAVHDAVQRLLNRNPNVTVGIQGPHVSSVEHTFNHAIGGDPLGNVLFEMIHDIFADLQHKVVFIDGWEKTVALANPWYHPKDHFHYQVMRTFLAFRCS